MYTFYGKNEIILTILIVGSVYVDVARSKFGNEAKIEESDVKQGETTPAAISSRFLDLGGVISQLFSGFNQGSPGGGGAGLNLPPNSQFYPSVPGQNGNFQRPPNNNNQGNNRQLPNQGTNQNRRVGNQQQLGPPNQNSLNFNNNLKSNQGWQNQNNNNNPSQGSQKSSTANSGNNRNNQMFSGGNEGTLDDFFTTQRTTQFGNQFGNQMGEHDHRIIFPDHDEEDSVETDKKGGIWGKKVLVPSTTPSGTIHFNDSGETPSQKQCVQSCPTTSEYNPVCGTDEVTYFNPGRLICARNCGIHVFEARRGNCNARG